MDLYTFLQIVLRKWWLITLAVLITAGTAAYTLSYKAPIYQAATKVVLKPSPLLTEPNLQINAQNSLERRTLINTLAEIAQTGSMQEQVAKTLNISLDTEANASLSAIVVPDANLIEIRVRSTNAKLAADIANAAAQELSKQVPQQTFQMDIIDRASVPSVAIEPRPIRIITLAVLFGVVLGIAFALVDHFIRLEQGVREVSSMEAYTTLQMDTLTDDQDKHVNTTPKQPIFTR